jgi:protoheme IX farnesyltransferase
MLGVQDDRGIQTRSQSVLYATALLPASLLPLLLGLSGSTYAAVALALSLLYLGSAARFALRGDSPAARALFLVSLFYLPLLLGVLSLNNGPGFDGMYAAGSPAVEVEGPAAALR